jgi:hypothetical protein
MADLNRRFTVLWTARSRDKRSAVLTEPEAQKLATKLRTENVEGVVVREGLEGPLARQSGRR